MFERAIIPGITLIMMAHVSSAQTIPIAEDCKERFHIKKENADFSFTLNTATYKKHDPAKDSFYLPSIFRSSYQPIKTDSYGRYFRYPIDTHLVGYYAKNYDTFKLFTKDYRLLRIAKVVIENDVGELDYNGFFYEYYSTGKPKAINHFDYNIPSGDCAFYYPNGQMRLEYHYGNYLVDVLKFYMHDSIYKQYYETGLVKVRGRFSLISCKDSIGQSVTYEATGIMGPIHCSYNPSKLIEVEGRKSVKTGTWYYYNSDGSLLRKEKYKKGRRVR